MIRARLSGGLLVALLGGCATAGKDYTPPERTAPAAYVAGPAGVTGTDVEVRWWRTFGDPALDQLIARALAANLDAKLALARLDEARALLPAPPQPSACRVAASAPPTSVADSPTSNGSARFRAMSISCG
jgi:multidrug efflux system outer membrane protein